MTVGVSKKKLLGGTLLERLQVSQHTVLLGMAVVVGSLTGLGAVIFIRLIGLVQQFFFDGGGQVFSWAGRALVIVIPAVGGLLAGPIITFFANEAKGHGVPEVMKAIALRGGRIRPRVAVAKVVASALCIGSGGSAGREGPIVQVGAALGSTFGQLFKFSDMRVRNLVACGAAAGIAATFNAPIAGVIFATEIILGELVLGDMGSVVLAAVTSSTVSRVFLGDNPAFSIPLYTIKTPWEILLYALLGLFSALAGVGFIKILYKFEDLFDHWRFPDALKPMIGGLLLGLVAFIYPLLLHLGGMSADDAGLSQTVSSGTLPLIYGAGFTSIQQALLGSMPLGLLLFLVFLKPLATSLTLGSGNSGGVFAPGLFMGAALGGAFGHVVEMIWPGATAGVGAFAVVGMAAVFAAAARAPFTAILIVLEMTNDYRMILPLMAGVIVSLILAERLHKDSIYTLKLTRQGIRLQRGRDVDVMEAVRVEEVMHRNPVTIPANMSIELLSNEFIRTGRHGFPVVNPDGSLYGVVSLEDYRNATSGDRPKRENLTVADIATRALVTVNPTDSVGTAMRRMAPRDLSRLLVVDHEDAHKLLGVVRRNDIIRAYEVGVVRREEARRRAEALSGVSDLRSRFIDIAIASDAKVLGKTVAQLTLPRAAVLVSIRRDKQLVIPHGDTILEEGDIITALVEQSCEAGVREALS
jgi:CIC family chloride channel protein